MTRISSSECAPSQAQQVTVTGGFSPKKANFYSASSLGASAKTEEGSGCLSSIKKTIIDFFKNLTVFVKRYCCCSATLPPQVKKLQNAVNSDKPNKQAILDIVNKEIKEGRPELFKVIGARWLNSGLMESTKPDTKEVLEGIGQKALNAFNPEKETQVVTLRLAVKDFVEKF